MTLKTSKLRDAIAFALVAGMAVPGFAFAQDQTETETETETQEQATTLDKITVTGTRIQSQTVTSSAPIAEIDREEVQYSGATRMDDLVNQYPQMAPYFDSFNNNGALGYPAVNLRGLGSTRTLTLVNGHRLPPGDFEIRDISIIPASLVRRVDILTGGASAVYGSDAMAGVVNFILDTDFEGFSANFGYSAYQHDNRNEYLRPLMDARGFDYPDGNSGFDGISRNIDFAVGSRFADGAGHAMAWFTWRENDPLLQGERDYSSCALNAAGTVCGGSSTAPRPNFFVIAPRATTGNFVGFAHLDQADGSWNAGVGELYNYAPINYYQRPDERRTFGSSVKYEINEHFRPYMEIMAVNRSNRTQIAETGTFFVNQLVFQCTDPLIGTMCSDLGLNPAGDVVVYVGKRNVEGGPRISATETNAYRVVTGVEGDLDNVGNWAYNVSFLYGHNASSEQNINDFLVDRVGDALLGCPEGSFSGCIPYNVWVPGGVTREAALGLQGVGMRDFEASISVANAYVTGDTPWVLPWSNGEAIALVAGGEWRKDEYRRVTDSNMQAGNFTGLGGPRLGVAGQVTVSEVFMEAIVPLIRDAGMLRSLDLDLGYRLSDYSNSGKVDTWKAGFNTDFGMFRVRGGYNRAIRGPTTENLFADQQIALWGGDDPCAGATPEFTLAQCQNTGVTPGQYGTIQPSPAAQYNQFIGGNPDLTPEKGDTYTLGIVAQPFTGFTASVDYYDIKLEDRIGTIGASTILRFCGLTGDPFLCSKVRRNPNTGDLWLGSDPNSSGLVENLIANIGELRFRGIDIGASYRWDMLGGRFVTSFQGTRVLEETIAPLAGINDDATYDCVGTVNVSCQSPEWRHIANVRFSRDWYAVNLRWRYTGAMDYVDQFSGEPLTTDRLICDSSVNSACMGNGELGAESYIDLSGSAFIGDFTELTVGVNNIADKEPPMVGSTLAANANAPGGYDQAGRYVFANLSFKF